MNGDFLPNGPLLTRPVVPGLHVAGGSAADLAALRFELAAAVVCPAQRSWPDAAGNCRTDGGFRDAGAGTTPLIVIDGDPAVVAEAAATGTAVLWLPGGHPDTASLLAAVPGHAPSGFVLCPSRLRHTEAGQQAADAIGSGRLGTLLSACISIRAQAGTGRPSLTELAWEAMDLVAALTCAPLVRAHAVSGDGLITAIMRFEDETVVTADVAAVAGLPADSTADGFEAEAELVGSDGLLRVEPFRAAVRILGPGTAKNLPFGACPLRGMLAEFFGAIADLRRREELLARQQRTLSLVAATAAAASPADTGSWHA